MEKNTIMTEIAGAVENPLLNIGIQIRICYGGCIQSFINSAMFFPIYQLQWGGRAMCNRLHAQLKVQKSNYSLNTINLYSFHTATK